MFAETLVPACAYSSHRLNHCHSRAPISPSLSKSAIDCFSLSHARLYTIVTRFLYVKLTNGMRKGGDSCD